MVKHPSELSPGSRWAYRAKQGAELQEVRVIKLGVKYANRAFIAFLDDAEEGEETWTPIGRLQCPWEDLAHFQDIEAKWAVVAAASAPASDVQAEVADIVFGCFDETQSLNYWARNHAGVTVVRDPDSFRQHHSISWEDFVGDLCFEDAGELVLPLDETLELARGLALGDPERIQRYLEVELAKASEEHIELVGLGRAESPRWTWNGSSTRPRIKDVMEAAAIIRGWLGSEQTNSWDEIRALRSEITRLSSIVAKAAWVLEDRGLTRDAASIRRLHGLTDYPVPRFLSYQEMTKKMMKDLQTDEPLPASAPTDTDGAV
ncbi:hypothetical protein [Paenarthrobacter nicotinovorans]|uniref:hypothetical protein n=1 Tax=Paenarthrobacter nicotinovorans TaxID=29320 RepID=UPI0009A641DA|nr:hypothetical protein [Paenarthrobacter nicotinovorans]MDI2021175.1 hypothetical protein [Paenarthrobacter nicotinovorans]SKB67415.1 hypothetical protein SAMN05660916_02066 [Arthrobacter sp. 31Cvi3.1E]